MTIHHILRQTTSPPAPIPGERRRPPAPQAIAPVEFDPEVEADRRRTLREELDTADERLPMAMADDQEAQVADVLEALARLGGDAARLLQPIDEKTRHLLDPTHVDEQV